MLYESKGSWNNNYGNYGTFFSIDQFKVLQIVTDFISDLQIWIIMTKNIDLFMKDFTKILYCGTGKATFIEGSGYFGKSYQE